MVRSAFGVFFFQHPWLLSFQRGVQEKMSEMITNEAGMEKQDCEQNALKRWLVSHKEAYAWLKQTILGDDLFSNYPTCTAILDARMSFILTCKPDSHQWLTETVETPLVNLDTQVRREWNGRNQLVYPDKWVNGVQIRDNKEILPVNYLLLEI